MTKPKLIVPQHIWDGKAVEKQKKEMEKVPNPTIRTSPPELKAPEMASNTPSTAFAASTFDKPALFATAETRSFLFTLMPPLCHLKIN